MNGYRHEYKYYLDAKHNTVLKVKVGGLLSRDTHTTDDGTYVVRSLYLDTYDDDLLYENISGCDDRVKYRIRYYNSNTRRIIFEKKSKLRRMCKKESCLITLDECKQIMSGHIPDIKEDDDELKKELFTEARLNKLVPKTIVTYTRTPFVYPCSNVRITFDEDITSSNDVKNFLKGNYNERPILEKGKSVLEVKWDDFMPSFIKDTMSLENYIWTAFSKYYMCRILHL